MFNLKTKFFLLFLLLLTLINSPVLSGIVRRGINRRNPVRRGLARRADCTDTCNAERFRQDFNRWTSGNLAIDEFIREAQLSATSPWDAIEFIPYTRLKKITHVANGGYGTIYKAIWIDGYICKWDSEIGGWFKKKLQIQNWSYIYDKIPNNDSTIDSTIECGRMLKYHLQSFKAARKAGSMLFPLLGITKNPETSKYIIVLKYAQYGNLRDNLRQISGWKWEKRLFVLFHIVSGLVGIYQSGIVHKDLHGGNILLYGVRPYINNSTPRCYASLMKKWWDLDPLQRPTANELKKIIGDWLRNSNDEFLQADKKLQEHLDSTPQTISKCQLNPEAFYTSRLLNPLSLGNLNKDGCQIKKSRNLTFINENS
ncbi:6057_t:CDS:2, partial [Gigaspora rosea]